MRRILTAACCLLAGLAAGAQHVISVPAEGGDMTRKLQAAIEQARGYRGKAVVIRLQNADYDLHRESSSHTVYYISNTTSERENPDQTKHIGLWLRGLRNVTVDGQGARLVMHGEMTGFVVDSCENVTLRDFTVSSADPTVPELTVTGVGSNYMDVRIHPLSRYTVRDGKFAFEGDSWRLDGSQGQMYGLAQAYDAERDVTWRCWSPLPDMRRAIELADHELRFVYDQAPQARAGLVFQMRDGIRDEACGLIQLSRNVTLERLHLSFLGNFGVVGQMSENITLRRMSFEPEAGSGRTDAGFADFVQMSGCKGTVRIEDSRFSGAHDDPINIHGTHLRVTECPAANQVLVRYMHDQTFGFQQFLPGNEVEFIDPHTLLGIAAAKVRKAEMRSPREILVTLDRNVPQAVRDTEGAVIENVTYTPEVVVRGNYFSRVPTRGLLVTTRRMVLVEDNVFFRMQMSGILIADDARSWYESGMVRDVTIRNNRFVECGTPVVHINPENDRDGGYVHSNITVDNNRFDLTGTDAVSAKSVDGLRVTGNSFFTPKSDATMDEMVRTQACRGVVVEGNRICNSY